jgi:KDO2-lipid IV(A) lauroyltransferase
MKPKEYESKLASLHAQVDQQVGALKAKMEIKTYCNAIANIKTFLPQFLDGKNPETCFREYLAYRSAAHLDHVSPERAADIKICGHFEDILAHIHHPRLYCTYHLGSYRALLGLLAQVGAKFSLVVNKQVYTAQRNEMLQTLSKIAVLYGVETQINIINSSEFNAAAKMAKDFRNGYSLVIYADGNTGTGGQLRHDERTSRVKFLGQHIYVRQGPAFFAHLFQEPIYPIISYRECPNEILLKFCPPIYPAKQAPRSKICQETMQKLFDILQAHIRDFPLQWDHWSSIHFQLDVENLVTRSLTPCFFEPKTSASNLTFNEDRFGVYIYNNAGYLLDYFTHQTYPLSIEQVRALRSYWPRLKNESETQVELSAGLIKQLLSREILIDPDQGAYNSLVFASNSLIQSSRS